MERRAVLGGVGTVLSSVLTGCAGSSADSSRQSFDPSDHVDDWQEEQVQGEADPIDTEEAVDSGSLEVRCGRVGRDALQSVVLDRLDHTSSLAFGFGRNPKHDAATEEEDEYRLIVERVITVGRDGDMRSKPKVSFSTLREVTPSEVDTTLRRDESVIHTCQHVVYVQDTVNYVD